MGFDTDGIFEHLKNGKSAIRLIDDSSQFHKPFYGAMIPEPDLDEAFTSFEREKAYTRLEKMLILSLSRTLKTSEVQINTRVGLIISTTKGNIEALNPKSSFSKERAYLANLGNVIKEYFGFHHDAILISNACVSGLLAVSIAKRYLQEDVYDHVFLLAGDVISDFVVSGFSSFHALSNSICKPYDQDRTGINIGEAAASILVTSKLQSLSDDAVEILGEGSANDANHISGPSRTGEGLVRSTTSALKEANLPIHDIDFISAHGTATIYNDAMEATAFNRLGMEHIPLHSLKGYFGHTMGAAGLLETIIGMKSLSQNILIASAGFENIGVSQPLNIISKTSSTELNTFLKTASGFGGCNTSAIFRKVS